MPRAIWKGAISFSLVHIPVSLHTAARSHELDLHMRDVQIYSSEEPEKNPLKRLWEGLVEFATEVLENDKTGQVAARIPFSGTIKDPHAGILQTIASVLHNAFVSAFARSLEGSISLRDVKKSLGKFGADDSKADKDKKKSDDKEDKKPGSESHKAPMQPES